MALLGPAAARLDGGRARRVPRSAAAACARVASVAPQTAATRSPDELPDRRTRTSPPPIIPPFPLPGDGYLLRETDSGWRDEQRTAFAGSGADRPIKSDPIARAARSTPTATAGRSAAGAASATPPAAASSARNAERPRDRARVQTAGDLPLRRRPAPPPARRARRRAVPLPAGPARLRGRPGTPQCERPCADLAPQAHRPRPHAGARRSRSVAGAARAAERARACCSTRAAGCARRGARRAREAARYAALLASQPGAPGLPGARQRPTPRRRVDGLQRRVRGLPAPFGGGVGARAASTPHPGARRRPARARTTRSTPTAPAARVRVVVIDNSRGLAGGERPAPEPARAAAAVADARRCATRARAGIPAIVVGSRDLNSRFAPRLNVADRRRRRRAACWSTSGASAYFFERPEENRALPDPERRRADRSPRSARARSATARRSRARRHRRPDALFGDAGCLLAEVDARPARPGHQPRAGRRAADPGRSTTSRSQAVDGTLLRRSRPALFQGLGRRPRGGDRWGRGVGGRQPAARPAAIPYTALPARAVRWSRAARRGSTPEYEFTLLRSGHRRLRRAGPELDEPAQAAARRRRQGRHRRALRPALPVQRGHDDGHRAAPAGCAYSRAGHRAAPAASSGRAARARCAPTASARRRRRGAAAAPPPPAAGAAPAAAAALDFAAAAAAPPPSRRAAAPRPRRAAGAAPPPALPLVAARRRSGAAPPCRRSPPRRRRRRGRSRARSRPAAPSSASTRSRRSARRRPRPSSRRPFVAYAVDDDAPDRPLYLLGARVVLAALAGAARPPRRGRRRARASPGAAAHATPSRPEGEPPVNEAHVPRLAASAAVAAGARRRGAVHRRADSRRRPSACPAPSPKPRKFGILRLDRKGKFPARAIPKVAPRARRRPPRRPTRRRTYVDRCAPQTVDLGTWCLHDQRPTR